MNEWRRILLAWEFEPSVVAGCVLLAVVYLVARKGCFDRRTWAFLTGIALIFFALVSPLDILGDEDLFSAHMAQHLLLEIVAPPLLVLGIPADLTQAILRWRPAALAERIFGTPVVAGALGVGTLWLWHLPVLYNATLADERIHIFEHLTFIVTGTIFWWPVFSPLEARRMSPLGSVVYLSLGGVAMGLLGIIFTISSTPFYSGYDHPEDSLGILAQLRGPWGLTQVADQQLGGSIMWVGGSLVIFCAILVQVSRWYEAPDSSKDYRP